MLQGDLRHLTDAPSQQQFEGAASAQAWRATQPPPLPHANNTGVVDGAQSQRLCVIEDDIGLAGVLVKAASSLGFETSTINDEAQWQANRHEPSPAILVLDLNLGFTNGLDCLEQLVADGFQGPVILISGCDDRVFRFSERICVDLGANIIASLNKPFSTKSFLEALKPLRQRAPAVSQEQYRNSIAAQEFVPFVQPITDLQSGGITDIELLARWQHPERGLVSPGQFIPSVERLGLMPNLSLSLLRQAIIALRDLPPITQTGGAEAPAPQNQPVDSAPSKLLTLSLNVSPSCLLVPGFSDQLLETISDAGGTPEQIKIELTEAVAFAGIERIRHVLTRLRIAGLRISIDDFGTGYSSLSALHELPFSDLKIDRSFVMRMLNDAEADTIVRSLIKLAHNLGLEVVGEGIESEAILTALKRRHCDRGQGFHIAKPMPIAALADRLNDTDKAAETPGGDSAETG